MLDVSRSGYYAWKTRPEPAKKAGDAQLAVEIAGAHKRSRGIYGSPRVRRDLKARGLRIGKKRVERLMRVIGLQGRSKRRFCRTTDSKHALPIAPNLSVATKFEGRRIKNIEGRGDRSSEGRITLLGLAQDVVDDASIAAESCA